MARIHYQFPLLGGLAILVAISTATSAQTVIQVPPQTVPDYLGADTTLIVTEGAQVHRVRAMVNSLTRVQGGSVGGFAGWNESQLEVVGGIVGNVNSHEASQVTVTGGSIGQIGLELGAQADIHDGTVRNIDASNGSAVNVRGGSIRNLDLNHDSRVSIIGGSIHNTQLDWGAQADIHDGNLERATVIRGSTLNLHGGNIEHVNVTLGGLIAMNGGSIDYLHPNSGSEIQLNGGVITYGLPIGFADVKFTLSGGRIDGELIVGQDSEFTIQGGYLDSKVRTDPRSIVTLSGGRFSERMRIFGGEIRGSEFRLNGNPYDASLLSDLEDGIFTGVFADGTPFFFDSDFGDILKQITLTESPPPPADLHPMVVDSATTAGPLGLRPGQTLTLREGGSLLEGFTAIDANLRIDGGSADKIKLVSTTAQVDGGQLSGRIRAFEGSHIEVTGGNLAEGLTAVSGSHAAIRGGEIDSIVAGALGYIDIHGGEIGSVATVQGSSLQVRGGTFSRDFYVRAGSRIEIYGSEFYLDGNYIDDPFLDSGITLLERDMTLSGVLSDGSPFIFDLNHTPTPGEDYFDPAAVLTVTKVSIVPEPGSLMTLCAAAIPLLCWHMFNPRPSG